MSIDVRDGKDSVGATADRCGGLRIDEHNFMGILGAAVFSADDRFIGEAWRVYLTDDSKRPEWLIVRTRGFESTEHAVPLAGATMASEGVWVRYLKHAVKNAPPVRADQEHMSRTEKGALHRHYGVGPMADSGRRDQIEGGDADHNGRDA